MATKKQYAFAAKVESVDQLAEILGKQTTFYARHLRNSDGTPARARVNGMLKRWKKDPTRMRLPLKHGLYDTFAVESLEEFNNLLAVSYEEIK